MPCYADADTAAMTKECLSAAAAAGYAYMYAPVRSFQEFSLFLYTYLYTFTYLLRQAAERGCVVVVVEHHHLEGFPRQKAALVIQEEEAQAISKELQRPLSMLAPPVVVVFAQEVGDKRVAGYDTAWGEGEHRGKASHHTT
ncbi:hypothetical protein TcasGA2_TC003265 [Tribolium castaneum]|uniref:Uncharacterized protein n=1 Tax=Tribolium castaneum TaxID=7070 RepID=D6WEH4_TRICA|nr:hypothetical protein TcasGA2_TC003265 [Tribolium castaneum]